MLNCKEKKMKHLSIPKRIAWNGQKKLFFVCLQNLLGGLGLYGAIA